MDRKYVERIFHEIARVADIEMDAPYDEIDGVPYLALIGKVEYPKNDWNGEWIRSGRYLVAENEGIRLNGFLYKYEDIEKLIFETDMQWLPQVGIAWKLKSGEVVYSGLIGKEIVDKYELAKYLFENGVANNVYTVFGYNHIR